MSHPQSANPTIPTEELAGAMEKLSRAGVGLCTEDPAKYMAGLTVRDAIAIREHFEALEAVLEKAFGIINVAQTEVRSAALQEDMDEWIKQHKALTTRRFKP